MFTGIIEEVGKIKHISLYGNSGQVAIKATKVLEGTRIGDSIAVNGVCLTVTSLQPDGFTADIMAETVRRSSLSIVKNGDKVNLERAMPADGRFGGHIVSGHIDGMGTITAYKKEENALIVTDLLADVVIYPDGFVKVLDINELAIALEKKLCDPERIMQALKKLDNLLNLIYDDKFDTLSSKIEKWIQ